jgi:hypothetical protein
MGRAFRSRAEHRQEVISAVTALRAHRLEIEIGIRIGLHPLDDSTKDVEWQSPFGGWLYRLLFPRENRRKVSA